MRPARGIAVGQGAVWVANDSGGSVARVDPATGQVVTTINVGRGPDALTVGPGALWVANSEDDTVSLIDPKEVRCQVAASRNVTIFGSLQVLPPSKETLTAKPVANETRLKTRFA